MRMAVRPAPFAIGCQRTGRPEPDRVTAFLSSRRVRIVITVLYDRPAVEALLHPRRGNRLGRLSQHGQHLGLQFALPAPTRARPPGPTVFLCTHDATPRTTARIRSSTDKRRGIVPSLAGSS